MALLTAAGGLTVATVAFFVVGWKMTRLAIQAENDGVWQRFGQLWQAFVYVWFGILLLELGPSIGSTIVGVGNWVIQLW